MLLSGLPEVVSSLYFFNQSFYIEYASMTTLFNFQFPESHKIIFAGMQTFARNPKSTQFQISRILNFQSHKIGLTGGKKFPNGRNIGSTVYCTLTLIAIQGHQKNIFNTNKNILLIVHTTTKPNQKQCITPSVPKYKQGLGFSKYKQGLYHILRTNRSFSHCSVRKKSKMCLSLTAFCPNHAYNSEQREY